MIHHLLNRIDNKFPFEEAKAHCDIPCGIYDPIGAQIASLTVVRMVDLITELGSKHPDKDVNYFNSLTRYILVKEEHAEKVKHEIRVIFGDYIKAQHLEKFPELPALVHQIMQLGSKNRQTVDREAAVQLVDAVNQFAQVFWETKGVGTHKAKAPYAPALELVYPNL